MQLQSLACLASSARDVGQIAKVSKLRAGTRTGARACTYSTVCILHFVYFKSEVYEWNASV